MTVKEWKDYDKPSVTADIVIFTLQDKQLKVLLVKRDVPPFRDSWAIPGGFVRMNENLEQAAIRELKEETGVDNVYLEQLYTFGEPSRDPRGRVITVAYMALVNSNSIRLKASTDVSDARWFPLSQIPKLAFDHEQILSYAPKRLKWKFEYTTVGFSLLPEKFSIGQLLSVYEIVFNKKFDKRNFIKKILSLNILKPEGIQSDVPYRPPQLYSLKADIGEIVSMI